MHEIGIVQNLIDAAVQAAGEREIKRIHVALGELSDVSRESLEFYFEQLRSGTPAADASLVVRAEAARARCMECQAEAVVNPETWTCPTCGSPRLQVVAGDRLVLEELDVE